MRAPIEERVDAHQVLYELEHELAQIGVRLSVGHHTDCACGEVHLVLTRWGARQLVRVAQAEWERLNGGTP